MFGTRWAIVHRDQTFSEPLTRALEDVPRTAGSFASLRRVRVLSLSLHTSSARSLRTGDRFPDRISEVVRVRGNRKSGKIG